jgi:acyl dehydratase
MTASYSLNFSSPPKSWTLYPKVLVARKPRHVREGRTVPRIEAVLANLRVDRGHLASYCEVCGGAPGETLPIAYPHVLASPLHMAILTSSAFPVQLLGLVHVRNRIVQRRPVRTDETGEVRCAIEGHRETERGQEFDLTTSVVAGGEELWTETSTFLSRRRSRSAGNAESRAAAPASAAPRTEPQAVRTTSFNAPAGLGRSYAWVSGDFNPIHITDATAKLFGFDRAIAHGMWSLARCAAELPQDLCAVPCELDVSFKLPILLPSWVMLQAWERPDGVGFALRDAQGEKPHLTGSLLSR